jgi:hypothetical protein
MLWLTLASLYALTQMIRGSEPLLSWLGLGLSAFAPLAYLVRVFVLKSPRTPRHPLEYSIVSGLGLALTMAMSFRYQQASGAIHIWAGVSLLGWLVYLRWYSRP